ncbi:hypothetical protein [Roseibium alexandrii]|uniref:hypothetical protein n=1 Tax=Roseibium alexandrii TaxID=388408 RepID=UPI0037536873
MRVDDYSEAQILKGAATLHQMASEKEYRRLRAHGHNPFSGALANLACSYAATGRAILFQLLDTKK